ncbi:DUF6053 domain-containing protein [Lysobacter yananisis]|uniref:DUF6053 domain-containing protein n=1 Tax=Lysobacter yananisis TaxID=1003114 RepID=UPI003CE468C6
MVASLADACVGLETSGVAAVWNNSVGPEGPPTRATARRWAGLLWEGLQARRRSIRYENPPMKTPRPCSRGVVWIDSFRAPIS